MSSRRRKSPPSCVRVQLSLVAGQCAVCGQHVPRAMDLSVSGPLAIGAPVVRFYACPRCAVEQIGHWITISEPRVRQELGELQELVSDLVPVPVWEGYREYEPEDAS